MARQVTMERQQARKPRCANHGCGIAAREDSYFCSNECAAEWAETEMQVRDGGQQWCPQCQKWTGADYLCGHGSDARKPVRDVKPRRW